MLEDKQIEENLTIIAIIGLADPLKAEIPNTIKAYKEGSISVIMITGDNKLVA
jgi:P-type E1-E2 ATPase